MSGSTAIGVLNVAGDLQATWDLGGTGSFSIAGLSAVAATVRDAGGALVGTGAIGLSVAADTVPALVVGGRATVLGAGQFAFYGPAGRLLSVSGEWDSYTATLTGSFALTVSAAGVTLNGLSLPAGAYTIIANTATLTGRGATSSPTFSGSATVTLSDGTVHLGPGTGTPIVGGSSLNLANGATLTGYSGTLNISGSATANDSVTLAGTATHVLSVSANPATVNADQNTPATFQVSVSSSLGGNYDITADAPTGWLVRANDQGQVTVMPASGLPSGTYPVRVLVRSSTNSDLVAQATVNVVVTQTAPGLTLTVAPDPTYTVPNAAGAQAPTAFLASVQNRGSSADTYGLTFANLPAGFELLTSGTTLTVPPGLTGELGVYLQPTGTSLLAPGTPLSFTVTSTSTTNPVLTDTRTVTFVMPQAHGLITTATPVGAGATPGTQLAVSITLTAIGNVPETVTLSTDVPAGLTLTGLPQSVMLSPGQSVTLPAILTPAAATPLNTTLGATVTAKFSPLGEDFDQPVTITVRVVAPGADAAADAAASANQAGNPDLANRLSDLATAITNLFEAPDSLVFKDRVLAALDATAGLVAADFFLAPNVQPPTAARLSLVAAVTPAEILAALGLIGDYLAVLEPQLLAIARHGFTFELDHNTAVVQPNLFSRFNVVLQNVGSQATTYNLALNGFRLGQELTGRFVRNGATITSVTLQPGQVIAGGSDGITLELRWSGASDNRIVFNATVTAQPAIQLARSTTGALTVRPEFISVASVVATPPFTNPGGLVNVTARLLNGLNMAQDLRVSYIARDSGGAVVFIAPTTAFNLAAQGTALTPLALAPFDTTGLALGEYVLDVSVTDAAGNPIPGGTGSGRVRVGTPVTAALAVAPEMLPTGRGIATNTLTVSATVSQTAPFTLVGQAQTTPLSTSVVVHGTVAYVAGTEGVDIVNVSNPAAPVVVDTIAEDLINLGGFTIVRELPGDRIAVGSTVTLNATGFDLLIYSVADPLNPALLSSTRINQVFLTDFQVSGTTALVSTFGNIFLGGNFDNQIGDVTALDLAAAGGPAPTDRLLGMGTAPRTGNTHHFGIELADADTAYVAGTSTAGFNTTNGTGRVKVMNFADPANLVLTREVSIPGTLKLYQIGIDGNTALAVGTNGPDVGNIGNRVNSGRLILTTLDVTDRDNPVVLSTEVTSATFPQVGVGFNKMSVIPVGGGHFAVSQAVVDGTPAILLVDASNPQDIRTSALRLNSDADEMTAAGGKLYVTSAEGLLVYDIGQVETVPVTASVRVPNVANAGRRPNTFNIVPDRIIPGAGFDTLEWDRQLGAGLSTQTFTWDMNVIVFPGEVQETALGGTVTFTTQGTPGTITLPPTGVSASNIIALSPASQTGRPGELRDYTITINNPVNPNATYNLTVNGVPASWISIPVTARTNAQGTATVTVQVTPDRFATLADYGFTVNAAIASGPEGTIEGTLTVTGTPVSQPDPEARGVVATLTPSQATAGQGTSATYTIRVTNTGSVADTFAITTANLPAGVTAVFEQATVDVPPGISNFRQVLLTLIPAPGTALGDANFQVAVTSNAQTGIADTVEGTLTVLATGVNVDLNPPGGPPGSTFQMTVTNTGQVADTFDLSLAAPTALVATLGTTSVSLAPGQSQVVSIAVGAVDFAVPGSLGLVGIATSRTDAAVKDADLVDVNIAGRFGLAAGFDEAMRELSNPGATQLLLLVENIGNLEDAYSATILRTTGSIAASLVDLSGEAAQTVEVFRLPGLSTGALLVNASLTDVGTGTVTVLVKSLTSGAIEAEATASVIVMDTSNPTVTVDIVDTLLNAADNSSSVTFTFSETTTDFMAGDVTVLGGTLSAFSGSGTSYTATFTANDALAGPGTVTVPAGSYTDGAGNLGAAASDTVPIDTLNPTLTVNIVDTLLNDSDNSSSVTFTFSETTTDFVVGDVTVLGGTLSAFSGSGNSYTATFTADDALAGSGTVTVPAGSYTDGAGNPGASASDTVPINRGKRCFAAPEILQIGTNTLVYSCAAPLSVVAFAMSTELGRATHASGVTLDVLHPEIVAFGVAWVDGTAVAKVDIPERYSGQTVSFQAFEFQVPAGREKQVSNLVSVTLGPAPLRIAGAEGDVSEELVGPVPNEIVAAAVARWVATGLTASELRTLHAVSISIDDLPTGVLAVTEGSRITLEATAAGQGWFVDPTPHDDAEFQVVAGTTELASPPGSSTSNRVDLFTVLLHELGHVLGRRDLANGSRALMAGELSAGVRRLPEGASPHSPQARIASPPWQNLQNRYDVDLDGVVSPLDALLVINELNLRGSRLLTTDAGTTTTYSVDVTGDKYVSAIDALSIINMLNERVAATLAAEGEATDIVPQAASHRIQPLIFGFGSASNHGWPTRQAAVKAVQPAATLPTVNNRCLDVDDGWIFEDETIRRALNSLELLSLKKSASTVPESCDDIDDEIAAVAADVAFVWERALICGRSAT